VTPKPPLFTFNARTQHLGRLREPGLRFEAELASESARPDQPVGP
jgi:hypothetical protein